MFIFRVFGVDNMLKIAGGWRPMQVDISARGGVSSCQYLIESACVLPVNAG